MSFSNPPLGNDTAPTLSAPIGARAILAGVRAPPPQLPVPVAPRESTTRKGTTDTIRPEKHLTPRSRPTFVATSVNDTGTMSRGPLPTAGGRSSQITPYQWLANVNVGNQRDGSSGPGNGGGSGDASRVGSRSRPPSVVGRSTLSSRSRDRSWSSEREEKEPLATLQEE